MRQSIINHCEGQEKQDVQKPFASLFEKQHFAHIAVFAGSNLIEVNS